MKIRAATECDLGALADLHTRAFARGWDEAALKGLMDGPGVFAFVAQTDDLDGFILIRVAADETEILTIAVGPDARRRGLGSILLEHASLEAVQQGAARMFLEVAAGNQPARSLYEKYGFREVGKRRAYYEDGDDAMVLSAVLPLTLRMGNPEKTL